jgi:hypothetical protein
MPPQSSETVANGQGEFLSTLIKMALKSSNGINIAARAPHARVNHLEIPDICRTLPLHSVRHDKESLRLGM